MGIFLSITARLLFVLFIFASITLTASAQISANKSFSPITTVTGQTSTLTIQLFNSGGVAATSVNFTDSLPSGLVLATPPGAATSCGGVVTATAGAASVSLAGGTIPAAASGSPGTCTLTVSVYTTTAGSYVNTIATGAVSTSLGANGAPASATLTVAPAAAITGTKSFSPANLHANGTGTSRITITLSNSNPMPLTNTSFTDTMPSGMTVAAIPNTATTCTGGIVSATPGASSFSYVGGIIPTSGSCTISTDVAVAVDPTVARNSNSTNTLAANSITTTQAVTNSSAIAGNLLVQSGAQITKAFSPTTITSGGTATLTLTLSNFNLVAITPVNFIDAMPAGITVTAAGTNTCGGSTTFTASQAEFVGVTVPAATTAAGAASCSAQFTVTSSTVGANVNSVPAGTLNTINYASTSATLTVNPTSAVTVSKAFSTTSPSQTGTTNLTITLSNTTASPATITSFTDNLTTMGTGITIASSPAASTTCGGTVTAAAGDTTITKTDGTIPASGSCNIVVPLVISATATNGTRTNTVSVNQLQTSAGNNAIAATATVNVQRAATVSKAFSPSSVGAGGVTRLTITLSHRTGAVAFTGLGISDPLPAGHTIHTTPNLTNTCGGTATAPSGGSTITLAGGALATGTTSCQIAVNVRVPAGAGSATNTILANALVTNEGVTYNTTATATITRINTSVTTNKGFSPTSIPLGGTATLSVILANNNLNAINLTGVAVTDYLPTGMVVHSTPSATFTGSGCSGATITATPGSSQVSISGASITTGSICTLAVSITTNFAGNLTNSILTSAVSSDQGITNLNQPQATLTLLGNADLDISKTNGASFVVAGGVTTYTINVHNSGPDNVADAAVADTAPTYMTFSSWTCSATSGSACATASGAGNINTTVTLVNGGTATFTVAAAISLSASGTISNTATVTAPPTVADYPITNNSATDTDTIVQPPSIQLVKSVLPAGDQVPGTELNYDIQFTNSGGYQALGLVLSDTIPAHTDFKLSSASYNLGTTGLTMVVEYSNDSGATWTYTPVSGGGGAPSGFDRNVTTLRWRATAGTLSEVAPANSGSVLFSVKIR